MSEPVRIQRDPITGGVEDLLKLCERQVIGRIEEIEGHVPSNDEIQQHGKVFHQVPAGKTSYFWRGVEIVRVSPPVAESASIHWKVEVFR